MQYFFISLCLGQFVFAVCTTGHHPTCSEKYFGLCSDLNLSAVTCV